MKDSEPEERYRVPAVHVERPGEVLDGLFVFAAYLEHPSTHRDQAVVIGKFHHPFFGPKKRLAVFSLFDGGEDGNLEIFVRDVLFFKEVAKNFERPLLVAHEVIIVYEASFKLGLRSVAVNDRVVKIEVRRRVIFEVIVDDAESVGDLDVLRIGIEVFLEPNVGLAVVSEFEARKPRDLDRSTVIRTVFYDLFRDFCGRQILFLLEKGPRKKDVAVLVVA